LLPSYPKQARTNSFNLQYNSSKTCKLQIIEYKQLEDQSVMKIAAVLFILSVCYIASTEQAAIAAPAPAGVYTYPSGPWKEMERKAGQQGMEDFKMKAKDFSQNAKAAQIPTDLQKLQECANQDCQGGEIY
jgi:hypothetical protein